MATGKKAPQTRKAASKTKAAKVDTGAVPPYGDPIHKAIARGDLQEMKKLSKSTRKWLDQVNAALAKLDASIKKAGG
ncbi:MAG TPA: DUF1843 domain-containing protein [Pyrinomonadaceae bacterium]|nr:DUF1843 domain-containing protein [Pyrinomonadaceae bacterium]